MEPQRDAVDASQSRRCDNAAHAKGDYPVRYEIEDRPFCKEEPCKVCKEVMPRSGLLGHARREHPSHFIAWLDGRGSFGMSIWEHLGHLDVDRPMTKL